MNLKASFLFCLLATVSMPLVACKTDYKPGTPSVQRNLTTDMSAVISQEKINLETEEAQNYTPEGLYRLGAYDRVFVYANLPDLLGNMPSLSSPPTGSQVDGDGYIQLPYVGRLHVEGMSLGDLREMLIEEYNALDYKVESDVVVELVEAQSQRFRMVGEFARSGFFGLDRPTCMLDAIAVAGGLTPQAFLQGAQVLRGDQLIPVDIYSLLEEGDMSQNIWLQDGDTIYVPDEGRQVVFVFGDVSRPGVYATLDGQLNLLQALSMAGLQPALRNDIEEVRVIRSHSATQGELIVINAQRILDGEALPFALQPGDLIYVPRSGIGTWNDAMRDILPNLQIVGNVLQPFVQLLVLEDRLENR